MGGAGYTGARPDRRLPELPLTRTRTTTTTPVATTALLILTPSLTACSGGSSGPDLSAADDSACTTLAALRDDDGAIDKWEVYRQFSASHSADLPDAAQSLLTSRVSHTDELNPLRDGTLRLCSAAGWTAPETGQGD